MPEAIRIQLEGSSTTTGGGDARGQMREQAQQQRERQQSLKEELRAQQDLQRHRLQRIHYATAIGTAAGIPGAGALGGIAAGAAMGGPWGAAAAAGMEGIKGAGAAFRYADGAAASAARFSPEVARAEGQAQAREMQRELSSASALGPELARYLDAQSQALDRIHELLLPIKKFLLEVLAAVVEFGAEALQQIVNFMGAVLPAFKEFLERHKNPKLEEMMDAFLAIEVPLAGMPRAAGGAAGALDFGVVFPPPPEVFPGL